MDAWEMTQLSACNESQGRWEARETEVVMGMKEEWEASVCVCVHSMQAQATLAQATYAAGPHE